MLVKPPANRNDQEGEENAVVLLPVEIDVYRPLEPSGAEEWKLTREERIISQEQITEEGIRIRQNLDDDDRDGQLDGNQSGPIAGENDLIEIEFKSEIPDGFELVIERTSALSIWTEAEKAVEIGSGSGAEIVVPEDKLPPRSYWLEGVGTGKLEDEELGFFIRPEGGGEKIELKIFEVNGFTSFAVGLSGEDFHLNFDVPDDVRDFGVYDIAEELYLKGYNVAYYNDDKVGTDGSGDVYREVALQNQSCHVEEFAIYGWSRGGGSTYNLTDKIYIEIGANDIDIPFAGYIDAIRQDATEPETELPVAVDYILNFYQRGFLGGVSILGADNFERQYGEGEVGHFSIVNDPIVINATIHSITEKLNEK